MDLDNIFSYHAPTPEQVNKYELLRWHARSFAVAITELVPAGADQTAAIRKLREALFTANAAVALDGKL